MQKFLIIFVLIALSCMESEAGRSRKRYVRSGYATSGNGYASAGGFAGGYAGSGSYAGGGGYAGNGVGGYSGSYSDDYGNGGFVGTGYGGYSPEFGAGFIDPYLFHQELTAHILAQHASQNNALASTYSTGDANSYADAASLPDDIQIQQQIAQQQAYFDGIRRQTHYNNSGYKANRYAPNFASASGSIGPHGYHQTAAIHPQNPANPNVVNRFSTSSSTPGGYQGVSVSSFSSSSDVNGKKTSHRGAQTTINDNGKVTTYSVHS